MTTAASLLILVAGITLVGLRANAGLTLGLLLTTPLFVRVSSDGLALGATVFDPQAGVTLPVAVFVFPIVFGYALSGQKLLRFPKLRRPDLLVVAFVAWAALALLVSALLGRNPALLVFVQAVGPVAFYVLGRMWSGQQSLRPLIAGMVIGSVLTCLWLGVSAALDSPDARYGGRIGDGLLGGITVYQAYDYFPLLLVFSLCGALGLLIESRQIRFASAAAILAGSIIVLYSRGALLAAAGAIVTLLVLWQPSVSKRAVVASSIGLVLVFAGSVAAGIPATTRLVDSFSGSDDGSESNSVRITSMRAATDIVGAQPLIGRGFEPTERAPGTAVEKTLNTHNQYLDYAVRGGPPLALLLLGLVGIAIVDAWRRARGIHGDRMVGAALAALTAGLISGLFQSPFIQPLTAMPLWLLLGHIAPSRRESG